MGAADGNSYEREAIEKLFESSNVSPLTNQPLKHKELVPNNALKQLIRSYEAQVHEKLVKLHEVYTLARTASRARQVEEKQALEEQLRLMQEADVAEDRIMAVSQDAMMGALVRSCSQLSSNSPSYGQRIGNVPAGYASASSADNDGGRARTWP